MDRKIQIGSPGDVAKVMTKIGDEWDKIVADALISSLSYSLRTKVLQRVPRSNPHVHPEYRDPESDFYHPTAGAQNLAKDFEIKTVRVGKGEVSARVGFPHVEYAEEAHEMQDPHPSGRAVRWSTPGTGNKYLDGPVEETIDDVLDDMNDNIIKALEAIER